MDIYRVLHFGAAIGIGVSGAVHVGIAAVGKCNVPANPYVVPNELIAAEIGRYLRLPIPPFCVIVGPTGENHFASLDFNLTGGSLPPVIPATFYNEFEGDVGSLLAFDAYIANSDRHNGNLSADYSSHRFNVFDHSHCLFSGTDPQGLARLSAADGSLVIDGSLGGTRHCLLGEIRDDRLFERVLERIESIPDWLISDIVSEAAIYGLTGAEAMASVDFLKQRRRALRGLIGTHRAVF